MIKNKKLVLCVCIAAIAVLCSALLLIKPAGKGAESINETKEPDVCSWEEYQAMTPEEQETFFQRFASVEEFEKWLESVRPEENNAIDLDWNKEGKYPDAYTWEEYQKLSLEEQEAFFLWFDSASAFEAWMESVKPIEEVPVISAWNKEGKLPNEYTWEEYQALAPEEQESFFLWFETAEAFELWKNAVYPAEPVVPVLQWDNSGKLPSEFTWEEYQDLKPEEQEAFYRWFGSVAAFEAWMDKVNPKETVPTITAWNKSGKKPNEYTWEEYEALTGEEQEMFYWWFGSSAAFETWKNSVRDMEASAEMNWNKSGKKPDEYTWKEYQALTAEEQDAFFQWFESMEAFEVWMNSAKKEDIALTDTTWNKPGKKPDEYTWEEYKMLSPEDQDLFYKWFGSTAAFEAWMERAKADAGVSDGPVWNKPGKTPDQYTKEEYLALTSEEQEAFFLWFESLEAFEAWIDKAEKP